MFCKELLGFDIRLPSDVYVQNRWVPELREDFLLKPEIRWPLSVDNSVWPSVFNELEETAFPPNSARPSLWFWFNLETMRSFFLSRRKALGQHGIPIAAVLIMEASLRSNDYWEGVLYPYEILSPGEVPVEWLFLGYDIADQYKLSGLTNCRYDDTESATLKAAWADRLNEFGLFQTLDDAIAFKGITDRRVQEHRPFYVYQLFRAPVEL